MLKVNIEDTELELSLKDCKIICAEVAEVAGKELKSTANSDILNFTQSIFNNLEVTEKEERLLLSKNFNSISLSWDSSMFNKNYSKMISIHCKEVELEDIDLEMESTWDEDMYSDEF